MGPVALPVLAEFLKDPKAGVRQAAAWALRGMGPEAEAALPALPEFLNDPEAAVREAGLGPCAGSAQR